MWSQALTPNHFQHHDRRHQAHTPHRHFGKVENMISCFEILVEQEKRKEHCIRVRLQLWWWQRWQVATIEAKYQFNV
jgi:hypothetical protein